MTDTVKIAVISAVGTITSGIFSTIVIVLMKRLEVKVDGRLTDLLNLTKKASHAEGVKEQQDK